MGLCEVYGSVSCNILRNLDGVSDYMIFCIHLNGIGGSNMSEIDFNEG